MKNWNLNSKGEERQLGENIVAITVADVIVAKVNDDDELLLFVSKPNQRGGVLFNPIPEAANEDKDEEAYIDDKHPCEHDVVGGLTLKRVKTSKLCGGSQDESTIDRILRPLRALIDPVTVLDMSEGMTREKLRMLKRIMLLVVSSFGPRERACHCGLLDRRRQFAQRSRVRKLQYIAELERNAEGLELSAQLQFLDQQNLILSLENKALKQRLDCLVHEHLVKCRFTIRDSQIVDIGPGLEAITVQHETLGQEVARLQTLYHRQQQQQQQQPPPTHRRSKSRDLDSQFANLSLKGNESSSGPGLLCAPDGHPQLLSDCWYSTSRFTTEGDNKSPTIKALPPKGNPNWQFPSAMALLTYSSTIPFSSSSSSSSSSTSLSSRRFPATPFRAHVSEPLDPWRFRSRLPRPHAPVRAKATLTVDSPATGDASPRNGPPRVLLEVKDLKAVVKESGQEILRGVNLTIHEGEVHAIMGKNGSGKSTFSKVLVGHQDYDVTGGSVLFKDQNLLEMEPEERSHVGLFMSFQTPVEIPGVSNFDFLLMAFNARRKNHGLPPVEPLEIEILQQGSKSLAQPMRIFQSGQLLIVKSSFSSSSSSPLHPLFLLSFPILSSLSLLTGMSVYRVSDAGHVLEADLAILDEIDSGLDVDALQDVAKAEDGMIVKTGDVSLAEQLEREGYRGISMS
ncbi:ABC transporter [Musa troglodytarum]|uniref:ABC transporter n=1 Tax=Musa troglodytarum TaxID=320322 RepID=A0A9E7L876_9LILI|nr:ABC transporter [Musa troglodytarum]